MARRPVTRAQWGSATGALLGCGGGGQPSPRVREKPRLLALEQDTLRPPLGTAHMDRLEHREHMCTYSTYTLLSLTHTKYSKEITHAN